MIHDTCFKTIEFNDDDVLIRYYIYDEYEYKDLRGEISFIEFKENLLKNYILCEKLGYCKIIHDDIFTTIKMPRLITFDKYNKIDKEYAQNTFIHKFEKLILEMWNNQIIHLDFHLGNIGIDENGDYKLLNLNEVYSCENIYEFLSWYIDTKDNFNFFNLEKKLNLIETRIKNISSFVSIL
jgi:hypothetical protein